jgi:long-chain-alcohol oxidase
VIEAIGYPSPDRRLSGRPLTAPKFTYSFITPPTPVQGSDFPIINTQILIIGSGAGGGVVASRLAQDYETLVIDKGVYAPTGKKHRGQSEAFEEMYQNGGFIASESGTISILAGSVFGGGTSINWSGSLKTQHYVREEWAKKKGLSWFLSKGYSDALDAVRDER